MMSQEELAATLKAAEKSKDTVLSAAITSWMGVKEDLGALVSIDNIEVALADDGYGADIDATFEKRKMSAYIAIDEGKTHYTAISFNPAYTTGERLSKAGLNTLMGMGTVFAVLIFLISLFKYIHEWEEKNKQKNAPAPAAPVPAPAPIAEEEELVDDLELVAVITAAIAASENTPADGLVVRSIKRAPVSKWKRA